MGDTNDSEAAKKAHLRERLNAPVQLVEIDGQWFMVSELEVHVAELRRSVVELLLVVDPAAWAQYRSLKYSEGQQEPSLEQRRAAYCFAFEQLLKIGYTLGGAL